MARQRRSAEPVLRSEEEPTVPGVPPAETPPEAPIGDMDPVMVEAAAAADAQAAATAEAARVEAEAQAAAAAAEEARVKAEAEEAERVAQAIRQAEIDAQVQAAVEFQAKVDAIRPILAQFFTNVRRTSKDDAVEWLGRMHGIEKDVANTAFDQFVSSASVSKETVKRFKQIEVDVEEFFLRSTKS